jgi:hypothetical protein
MREFRINANKQENEGRKRMPADKISELATRAAISSLIVEENTIRANALCSNELIPRFKDARQSYNRCPISIWQKDIETRFKMLQKYSEIFRKNDGVNLAGLRAK